MVDAAGRGQTDGWRYEDMPEDAEAWRRLSRLDLDAAPGALRRSFAPPAEDQAG